MSKVILIEESTLETLIKVGYALARNVDDYYDPGVEERWQKAVEGIKLWRELDSRPCRIEEVKLREIFDERLNSVQ